MKIGQVKPKLLKFQSRHGILVHGIFGPTHPAYQQDYSGSEFNLSCYLLPDMCSSSQSKKKYNTYINIVEVSVHQKPFPPLLGAQHKFCVNYTAVVRIKCVYAILKMLINTEVCLYSIFVENPVARTQTQIYILLITCL